MTRLKAAQINVSMDIGSSHNRHKVTASKRRQKGRGRMDKREAKKRILTFLWYQLDESIISEFVADEAKDDDRDMDRLWEMVEELREEIDRRKQ